VQQNAERERQKELQGSTTSGVGGGNATPVSQKTTVTIHKED
jgi:hypothetical protein